MGLGWQPSCTLHKPRTQSGRKQNEMKCCLTHRTSPVCKNSRPKSRSAMHTKTCTSVLNTKFVYIAYISFDTTKIPLDSDNYPRPLQPRSAGQVVARPFSLHPQAHNQWQRRQAGCRGHTWKCVYTLRPRHKSYTYSGHTE